MEERAVTPDLPELQPSAFAQAAPLYFDQLVVQTTWTCTARCAMCYQSAGPKGSDDFGQASLSRDDLAALFDGVDAIPMLESHAHLVGGEPLIDVDFALYVLHLARAAGFEERTLTSNGFWGRNRDTARTICAGLAAAGLTRLDLSWDRWRRPFISGAALSTCLEEAAMSGLPVRLRLLLSTQDTVEDLLRDLRPGAVGLAQDIVSDTVAATGRAARRVAPATIPKGRALQAACFRDLRLTVNPAGEVYPCCSGLDQTRSLRFGNIREAPLAEIVRRMDSSALLRKIVFEGIASLLPLMPIRQRQIAEGRSSICSLCWALFSDPDCVAALRVQYPQERWAA